MAKKSVIADLIKPKVFLNFIHMLTMTSRHNVVLTKNTQWKGIQVIKYRTSVSHDGKADLTLNITHTFNFVSMSGINAGSIFLPDNISLLIQCYFASSVFPRTTVLSHFDMSLGLTLNMYFCHLATPCEQVSSVSVFLDKLPLSCNVHCYSREQRSPSSWSRYNSLLSLLRSHLGMSWLLFTAAAINLTLLVHLYILSM